MTRDQVKGVSISSKNSNTLIVHFETVSKETIIFRFSHAKTSQDSDLKQKLGLSITFSDFGGGFFESSTAGCTLS